VLFGGWLGQKDVYIYIGDFFKGREFSSLPWHLRKKIISKCLAPPIFITPILFTAILLSQPSIYKDGTIGKTCKQVNK